MTRSTMYWTNQNQAMLLSLLLLAVGSASVGALNTTCFQCNGTLSSTTCGINVTNDDMLHNNLTISCDGVCFAMKIGTNYVKRGCQLMNGTREGCFYELNSTSGQEVFVCNKVCHSDYCNGAGAISPPAPVAPTRRCYKCEGNYTNSSCGIGFNGDVTANTLCYGKCIATTTASLLGFKSVKRGCLLVNETREGCYYQIHPTTGQETFVCNKMCDSDLCNGAGAIPPTPVAPTRQCFTCQGDYDSSSCGFDFDEVVNNRSVALCSDKCIATTTGFKSVKRGCLFINATRSGCFYDINPVTGQEVLVCNYICNSDRCNGAGVVPAKNPSESATPSPSTTTSQLPMTTNRACRGAVWNLLAPFITLLSIVHGAMRVGLTIAC